MASTRRAEAPDLIIGRGLGLGVRWGAIIGMMTVLVYVQIWGHVEVVQLGVAVFVLCGCAAVIGGLLGAPCGLSGAVAILLVLRARASRVGTVGHPADTRSWPARTAVIRAAAATGAAVPPAVCALLVTSVGATTFALAVAAEAAVAGAALGPRAAWGRRPGGNTAPPDPRQGGASPLHSAK
jgi:hypothetical protein